MQAMHTPSAGALQHRGEVPHGAPVPANSLLSLCASPGCWLPVADEPTSPKKAKSTVEEQELERWLCPEWVPVRVIPEEEMAEHNLLAVRVMVASDGSRYLKTHLRAAWFSLECQGKS